MIRHIVFFRLQDRSQENVARARQAMLDMRDRIPALENYEVGVDFVRSPYSYDVVFTATFPTEQELERYRAHPVHLETSAYLKEISSSYGKVDYYVEPGGNLCPPPGEV